MTYRIYCRASTDEQKGGLRAQEDACRKVAPDGVMYVDEGVSGSTPLDARPALMMAIADMVSGDVLLVARRDRIGRDVIHVAMIEREVQRKGCSIRSVAEDGTNGDDPSSMLMKRMIDAFAEYERLIIRARIKGALKAKQARGERTGGIMFGYSLAEDGVHLVVNEAERDIIEVAKMYKKRGMSYRKICDMFTKNDVMSRTGRPFAMEQVRRMVLNNSRGEFDQIHGQIDRIST